jgi:hypothetical protein
VIGAEVGLVVADVADVVTGVVEDVIGTSTLELVDIAAETLVTDEDADPPVPKETF